MCERDACIQAAVISSGELQSRLPEKDVDKLRGELTGIHACAATAEVDGNRVACIQLADGPPASSSLSNDETKRDGPTEGIDACMALVDFAAGGVLAAAAEADEGCFSACFLTSHVRTDAGTGLPRALRRVSGIGADVAKRHGEPWLPGQSRRLQLLHLALHAR